MLGGLLPRLDPKARGIGALLTVLLDESLRHARPVEDVDLRGWLAGFAGGSAAAKAAKALLALGTPLRVRSRPPARRDQRYSDVPSRFPPARRASICL